VAETSSAVGPSGRLILLTSTHRVAPGLLSWPAWEALRGADRVLVGEPGHPQLPYVRAAGVPVEVLDVPAHARARALAEAAARSAVVWISGQDGDPGLTDALAALAVEGGTTEPMLALELLPGSYDLPGARLLDLVAVMDRLRSPGGCPWDAEQTHASLVKYLVEEAYELVEAIEQDDREALREELGDVLLQVVFHARVAEEHAEQPFGIDEVAGGIVEKLMYRHPHVFGDVNAPTAEHVEANWEQLKAAEKQRESVTDGVPLAQPALSLAAKLMQRARKGGVQVPLETAYEPQAAPSAEDLGELLLALVKVAADHGIDPETALRAAARRYRDRIREAEGLPPVPRTPLADEAET
jgi:XTP/dITP diphosphohydrolase